MRLFLKRTRPLSLVLAVLMLMDFATVRAFADDANAKVTRTEFVGETVYVYYDLSGSPEQVYSVSLIMKKRSNPAFQYIPKFLTGDVGSSMFPGTGWRIAWNMEREFAQGVDQKDVYFVVDAKSSGESHAQEGSNTMLWMAGGAVVVGGIVALVLLNRNGDSGNGGGGGGTFPLPPGRP